MNTISPLSSLLLPVKDSELFRSTLPLVELISNSMGDKLEKLDLLHIVGGSFLSTHLGNIDYRTGHVLSSELMKRLRTQHYTESVNPMLEKAQDLLEKSGTTLQASVRVENGDPAKKISAICSKDKYSTLIMTRQKQQEVGIFTGSVLNGVLHRHFGASIYVVGEDGFKEGESPLARVVIGIDGSPASDRAVMEAALLLKNSHAEVEKISLVYVMDQSCLLDEDSISCQEASEQGVKNMEAAKNILLSEGVDEALISADLLFGKPGEALVMHARACDATMLYIGRRDRSNISQALLGSVCGDVIHRYREKTVALIS